MTDLHETRRPSDQQRERRPDLAAVPDRDPVVGNAEPPPPEDRPPDRPAGPDYPAAPRPYATDEARRGEALLHSRSRTRLQLVGIAAIAAILLVAILWLL